jgi:hypothetical protein
MMTRCKVPVIGLCRKEEPSPYSLLELIANAIDFYLLLPVPEQLVLVSSPVVGLLKEFYKFSRLLQNTF